MIGLLSTDQNQSCIFKWLGFWQWGKKDKNVFNLIIAWNTNFLTLWTLRIISNILKSYSAKGFKGLHGHFIWNPIYQYIYVFSLKIISIWQLISQSHIVCDFFYDTPILKIFYLFSNKNNNFNNIYQQSQ